MNWRVANSLDVLLDQLNTLAPHRSKASDGGIGDAAHATRDSDHNPWFTLSGQPLVTARDFTHDPGMGLDCRWLARVLQHNRDPRVKYVIWDRQIMSGSAGSEPWMARPYAGTNPHTKHLHLSVVADARCQDRTPWALAPTAPPEVDVPLTANEIAAIADAVWMRGRPNYWGDVVAPLQVVNGAEARTADVQNKIAASGGVDLDVLAGKVVDLLAARLGSE